MVMVGSGFLLVCHSGVRCPVWIACGIENGTHDALCDIRMEACQRKNE